MENTMSYSKNVPLSNYSGQNKALAAAMLGGLDDVNEAQDDLTFDFLFEKSLFVLVRSCSTLKRDAKFPKP